MKTGCTSGKKNFVFTFHSVCTVFVPFKMEHFQLPLIIRDLHNHKVVPYGAVIKTTRTFKHRVHIIRTVHTRDRKGASADTFVFKNLAPSGVRVCQNQKRFLFSTRIRIKVCIYG